MLLNIRENKQYDNNNLNLKESSKTFNPEKNDMDVKYFLEGEKVLLEKVKEDRVIDCKGKDGSTWKSAICNAVYEGEEVTFFLSEREFDAYSVLGPAGTKVEVSGETYEKGDNTYLNLSFVKID